MFVLVVYYLLFAALLCEVAELALRLGQTLVTLQHCWLCNVDPLVESTKRVMLLTAVGMAFIFLT